MVFRLKSLKYESLEPEGQGSDARVRKLQPAIPTERLGWHTRTVRPPISVLNLLLFLVTINKNEYEKLFATFSGISIGLRNPGVMVGG